MGGLFSRMSYIPAKKSGLTLGGETGKAIEAKFFCSWERATTREDQGGGSDAERKNTNDHA